MSPLQRSSACAPCTGPSPSRFASSSTPRSVPRSTPTQWHAVKAEIDAATARLRSTQCDGPFGVRFTTGGDRMAWGNPVIGIRNPIAPPLTIQQDADGRVFTDFHLGAAYEGPPGHVHGGVSALVLDHVLGEVAANAENPRFTGTITLRYLRPTRLGRLHAEASNHADRRSQGLRVRPSRRRRRASPSRRRACSSSRSGLAARGDADRGCG